MAKFFQSVYDYNICTYYLLPLIKVNKFSFGPNNFKQCFVNRRNPRKLYVRVAYLPRTLDGCKEFIGSQVHDGLLYVIFVLPEKWDADIQLFLEGKYSRMSTEAKEYIKEYAGMRYKQEDPTTGRPFTDARLLAIDADENQRTFLRLYMERELGTELPHDAELIQPPTEQSFIDDLIHESNITISLVAGT